MTSTQSRIWLNKANPTKTAKLYLYGDVGSGLFSEGVEAAQVLQILSGLSPEAPLEIHVNSPGGSVPEGLAIYNLLKQHKGKKTVVIDGLAASIAGLIAMAGDEVVMPSTALFMAHSPWARTAGNAESLRATAEVLDKWRDAMSHAYALKTGKPPDTIVAAIFDGEDHWYSAAEAVQFGFANRVEESGSMTLGHISAEMQSKAAAVYFAAAATSFPPTPTSSEKTMTTPNTETPVLAAVVPAVAALPEATTAPVAALADTVTPEAAVLDIQARIDAAVAQAHAEAQAKIDSIQAEAAQARGRLEAEVEAREQREVVAQVTRIYANLPGKVDDIAPALRALRKAAPDACSVVETVLASVNSLLANGSKTGFEPLGNAVVEELDAEQKVQKLADAKRLENPKMTIEQARSMVYTEHPELVAQLRGEKD